MPLSEPSTIATKGTASRPKALAHLRRSVAKRVFAAGKLLYYRTPFRKAVALVVRRMT